MDVVVRCVAGLDVHQKFVVACRRCVTPTGVDQETRTFSTMTRDLLGLGDWLASRGVTVVGMESTGVFWKPVWNLLEARFEVLLINARDVKQVPGRKTDVGDAAWIAQLVQYGLVRGSFIPPAPIRELRDLTRHRTTLVHETTAVANRIHKVLQDANIKLSAVASDILGVSGRAMLSALVQGETDPARLADLARRRLRAKHDALVAAFEGRVTPHHRRLLQSLLSHLQFLEAQIAELDAWIEEAARPFQRALDLLMTIPGVKRRVAESLLAEAGPDMTVFPTAAHLAAWTGLCPGNHETGGKRGPGTTRPGNRWLRRAMTEAGWAASHTKGTYAASLYQRLAGRRGKKRALVAVAHSLLVAAYSMLRAQVPYRDLGPQHFDKLAKPQLTRYHVKRLERLGYKVTLQTVDAAA